MLEFKPSYGLCVAVCVWQVLFGSTTYSQSAFDDSSLATGFMAKAHELNKISQYDSSIVYYQRANEILKKTNYRDLYLHSLNGTADNFIRKTQCDSALKVLTEAMQIEQNEFGGEGLESAETFSLVGYTSLYQDRADLAIEQINRGLTIRKNELGEHHPLVAASQYMLGVALTRRGDLDKALGSLEAALKIQRKENGRNFDDIASTLMAVGSIYNTKSEHSISIGYFSEALSLLTGSVQRNPMSEATCYFYLAIGQRECGDITGAIENCMRALNLSRDVFGKEHQRVSACYAKLAELYDISGDHDRAVAFCERALNMMVRLNGEKNSGVALIYTMLGGIYSNTDNLQKALECCHKALSIQRRISGESHPEIGASYEHAANIYEKQHQHMKALEYYRNALHSRLRLTGSEYRVDIGRIYLKIGILYEAIGKQNEASKFLGKALHILNMTAERNRHLLAATYKGLGDLYSQQRDYSRALSNYDLSINLVEPGPPDGSIRPGPSSYAVSNKKDLLEALTAEAQTYERRYVNISHGIRDLQAALNQYERAVELIKQLRRSYKGERSKLILQRAYSSVYEGGARVSVKLFKATGHELYKSSAFSFAEKSKANVLLDGIQEAKARHFAGIPDSMLEKEEGLRTDITLCETQVLKEQEVVGEHTGSLISLQNRLFTLDQEYQGLLEFFEASYPTYYELKYQSHFTTVAAIQQTLDEQTCVLEYFVGEGSLYIFIILKNSFDVVSLPKPTDFEQSTTAFCRAIRTIDQANYLHHSTALYGLLVQPIKVHLVKKKRLVIIPDGILYHVPFEALISGKPLSPRGLHDPVDFTGLPYLVNAFEISYAYSSNFYTSHELHPATDRSKSASFVGFAPVFRDSPTNGYIIASNVCSPAGEISELRSLTVDGKRFRELPYSEEEVRSITSGFAERGNPSIGYFHSDATKENFKREAGKYNYIHVATHSYMNEDHPELSALVFANPPDSRTSDDAIMYAGDIYNLRLNADLLVLSSCESGIGKIVKGEGMMGMTRGFLYAGARSIMYSLWKVFDKQTNQLMQQFYGYLLDGEAHSSSLRRAKLKMIENPLTAFPSKWAGFVLIGE
jgi:CHAT domain-containing protein/tetratricopeptide (TPR) repeat protein